MVLDPVQAGAHSTALVEAHLAIIHLVGIDHEAAGLLYAVRPLSYRSRIATSMTPPFVLVKQVTFAVLPFANVTVARTT